MAACFKYSQLGTQNYGASAVLFNDNGTSITSPVTKALVMVPDTATSDISKCVVVSISGAEYLALQSNSGSSGTVQTPTPQNWLELGNMSIADAQVISGYVGLLWATVWGIKQVIKSLSIFERNHDE